MDRIERLQIAGAIIRKLGAKRAAEASQPCKPPIPSKWGFDGVDKVTPNARGFRARIRFCDALSGEDTRITLASNYPTAEVAGMAYAMAHTRVWGAASRYSGEITTEELRLMVGAR
jgi:hypothetical protein